MTAATLLNRLDRVRETGPGRWIACCPAHSDKSPSLSIREVEGGRVLIHDFAGCAVEDVLAAVGLDYSALFPPRDTGTHRTGKAPAIPFKDCLRCIATEVHVVVAAAESIRRQTPVTQADMDRLWLAASRIENAWSTARGGAR